MGIRHKMDQIIAGTVINIGAVGITNFLFLRVLSRNTQFNRPPTIEPWRVPVLADIPVLGPILFSAKPYVYLMYVMVAVLTYMLFRTRWGLRLRASGEKPAAAGTVGIDVIAIRYRALLLAGLISGLAGSYLSLSIAGNFGMEMVAGLGFIALAAMIFGAWHPVGAFGAALVFGSPEPPRRCWRSSVSTCRHSCSTASRTWSRSSWSPASSDGSAVRRPRASRTSRVDG